MATDPDVTLVDWQTALPVLAGRVLYLREPPEQDLATLDDLLALRDATPFGRRGPATAMSRRQRVARARRDRANGLASTYSVISIATRPTVGLIRVRQLDAAFEGAEWESATAPALRGTVGLETAWLVGAFAFDAVGGRRLEPRTLAENGRANGALRKPGAALEGILRRSVRQGGHHVDQVLSSVLKEDGRDRSVSTPVH